jgi:hypothetical protein
MTDAVVFAFTMATNHCQQTIVIARSAATKQSKNTSLAGIFCCVRQLTYVELRFSIGYVELRFSIGYVELAFLNSFE